MSSSSPWPSGLGEQGALRRHGSFYARRQVPSSFDVHERGPRRHVSSLLLEYAELALREEMWACSTEHCANFVLALAMPRTDCVRSACPATRRHSAADAADLGRSTATFGIADGVSAKFLEALLQNRQAHVGLAQTLREDLGLHVREYHREDCCVRQAWPRALFEGRRLRWIDLNFPTNRFRKRPRRWRRMSSSSDALQ